MEFIKNFGVAQFVVMTADEFSKAVQDAAECIAKQRVEAVAAKATADDTNNNDEELLSSDQVCNILHCTPATLWRWNKAGVLSYRKIGNKRYFSRKEVNKALNS